MIKKPTPGKRAFTLLELLVVSIVVGVLAAMILPTLSRMSVSSERMDSINNLRSVALAVQVYASENGNTLPGPVSHAQWAYMRRGDTSQLAWLLRQYLGCENAAAGDLVKVLGNKRFFAKYDPKTKTAYIINHKAKIGDTTQSPWGYTSNGSQPSRMAAIDKPQNCVGLMEVDQKLRTDTGGRALGSSPEEPLFPDGRAAMFLDGHVEVLPFEYQLGAPYNR